MRGPNITSAPATVLTSNRTAIILTNIERDAGSGELHSAGFLTLRRLRVKRSSYSATTRCLQCSQGSGDAGRLKHSGDLTDRQAIADRLTQHDGPSDRRARAPACALRLRMAMSCTFHVQPSSSRHTR